MLNEGLQSDDISTNCTLFGKGVVIGENGENNQNVKWKQYSNNITCSGHYF